MSDKGQRLKHLLLVIPKTNPELMNEDWYKKEVKELLEERKKGLPKKEKDEKTKHKKHSKH